MQPRLLDTLFIALIFHVQSTVWWYETTNAHRLQIPTKIYRRLFSMIFVVILKENQPNPLDKN